MDPNCRFVDTTPDRGEILHREFVGMLFALVIAQVAVRTAEVINSDLAVWQKAPALSHLFLAAMVVATSWVGWGLSKFSLSNVKHVFTRAFVELVIDVWLVGVYFFIVEGAERLVPGGWRIQYASIEDEAWWIAVMFVTYVVWDLWTKWDQPAVLRQRLWASCLCAVLAIVTFGMLGHLRGTGPVLLGDLSLLALVLLFRGMKLHDYSAHTKRSWRLIAALGVGWLAAAVAARAVG